MKIINPRFGPVSDTFLLDDVRCSGHEADIRYNLVSASCYLDLTSANYRQCPHETRDNCGPGEGAGVVCEGGASQGGGSGGGATAVTLAEEEASLLHPVLADIADILHRLFSFLMVRP